MLRPKQVIPFLNTSRTWFTAGPHKSSSLDGSESSDFDNKKERRGHLLNRTSNNKVKEKERKNAQENLHSTLNRGSKPYVSSSNDLAQKAHNVHGDFVCGLTDLPPPGAASARLLNPEKSILDSTVVDYRENSKGSSISNINVQTKSSVQRNAVDITSSAKNVGLAAAVKFSDIQNTAKADDLTRPFVPKASQQRRSISSKQHRKSYSSFEKGGISVASTGGEESNINHSYITKDVKAYSTCSDPHDSSWYPNAINSLKHGLENMKLASGMVTPDRTEQASNPLLGGENNTDYRDKQHFVLECQEERTLPETLSHWHVNSNCQSRRQGDYRRIGGSISKKGKGAIVSQNGFRSAVGHSCKIVGEVNHQRQRIVEGVCSILKRLKWCAETELALSELGRKLSPYHVNEILKRQQDFFLALQFFKWAKKQETFKHDVHTYTTMLGILGRARKFDAIASLLEEMESDGCKPSIVTFNRLIHCYGRANQMSKALLLFNHMKSVGCAPDKVTYCTLIDLHAKAGFLNVAMDMYREMQKAGLQPDTFTYTVMINCLGKGGELSAAQKLLAEMISKGCVPNIVTYNILIDLHAKSGRYDIALKLYNEILDGGVNPDQVTYSIIMEVLGHVGHPDEAENVFSQMQELGWTPDATVYGLLVDMWGKAGNLSKSCAWYRKMVDSGVKPNVPTCNSLLGAFLRENLYDWVMQLLQDMVKHKMSPSLQTYTLLLSSYTMSERETDRQTIWNIMGTLNHPAHTFVCSLAPVRPYLNQSKEHILHYFEEICCEDQESKRSFTDAIVSFLHTIDMKEEAALVWEVAANKNIYPKVVTRKTEKYWAINLHTMSCGTALIALSRALFNLKEGMLTTGLIPERIDIITGWGRRSRVTGSSLVKQAVEDILKAVGSPFRLKSGNLGCFVGIGQPLVDWLYSSDIEQMHLVNV